MHNMAMMHWKYHHQNVQDMDILLHIGFFLLNYLGKTCDSKNQRNMLLCKDECLDLPNYQDQHIIKRIYLLIQKEV